MKTFLFVIASLLVAAPSKATPIAVVVSAKSNIASLTKSDVRDYFLGEKQTLENGQMAAPCDQSRSTAIMQDFYAAIASMSPRDVSVYWAKKVFAGRATPPPQVDGGDGEVKKWLKAKANGIGYVRPSSVDASVKVVLTIEQ